MALCLCRPVVAVALLGLTLAASPAGAQTPDAGTSQVERALGANQGNAALQQCLQNASAVEDYARAVTAVERSKDPSVPAKFNCSGIGASWQEVAPAACCELFERDKRRNVNAAWTALQQCGWRNQVEVRRPAYLKAAEKCLASTGLAVNATPPGPSAATPPPSGRTGSPVWAGVRPFPDIRSDIIGQDACAVTGGPSWRTFDNGGRQRALPGFLEDRVRRGFALLDHRAWLQAALASVPTGLSADQALARLVEGAPDVSKQYVLFGDGFVRHYLPGASLAVPVGPEIELLGALGPAMPERGLQLVSSEHGSVRGTCNGGGDFIRFDGEDEASSVPRLMRAAARTVAAREVHVELPGATVTAVGGPARVVVDLAPSGAAAVLAVSGTVAVREAASGSVVQVRAGDAVLFWPGAGLSRATALDSAQLARASVPPIRGSILLRPGQEWAGPLRIEGGQLPVQARLLYAQTAGAAYVLEVTVNGRAVKEPVLNKQSPMRYADGRNYPYREPNANRWLVFYSPDFEANNGPAGGGYEVKTDAGQAYRYVWDVRPYLTGGVSTPSVRFRNNASADGPTLELRLLTAVADARLSTRPRDRETTAGGPAEQGPAYRDGVAASEPSQPATTGGGSARLVVSVAPDTVPTGTEETMWVFAQGEDAAGNLIPWKPSDPVVVTLTSANTAILRPYGSDGHLARARTTGVPRYGTFVAAGPGTTTITASSPGFAPATVTVRTLRYASAMATTLKLFVAPPRVAVGERPIAVAQYVNAQGTPTLQGRRMDVTVEATAPDGVTTRASALFYGDTHTSAQVTLDLASVAGVTTLRATAPGFASAPVQVAIGDTGTPRTSSRWAPAAPASPPSVAAPSGSPVATGVVRNNDFGDAVTTGRVSNIVTARDVQQGAAVGITDVFSPDMNPIHLWFRLSGFAPGTLLTSRWTYLGGASPLVIGTGEFTVTAGSDYGTFSYELAAGKRWPAGDYRAEILFGGSALGSAMFTVSGGR